MLPGPGFADKGRDGDIFILLFLGVASLLSLHFYRKSFAVTSLPDLSFTVICLLHLI